MFILAAFSLASASDTWSACSSRVDGCKNNDFLQS